MKRMMIAVVLFCAGPVAMAEEGENQYLNLPCSVWPNDSAKHQECVDTQWSSLLENLDDLLEPRDSSDGEETGLQLEYAVLNEDCNLEVVPEDVFWQHMERQSSDPAYAKAYAVRYSQCTAVADE